MRKPGGGGIPNSIMRAGYGTGVLGYDLDSGPQV